jgi:hypothetical protein
MRVVRTKHSLPDDWWSQDVGPAESAGAHWEIGWDDELASFYAQLLMDYSPGELGENVELPTDADPVFAYGERPGQFVEVDQLEGAMADEVGWNPLPGDLVVKLEADRDRFLSSLSAEESRELVERLAAAG